MAETKKPFPFWDYVAGIPVICDYLTNDYPKLYGVTASYWVFLVPPSLLGISIGLFRIGTLISMLSAAAFLCLNLYGCYKVLKTTSFFLVIWGRNRQSAFPEALKIVAERLQDGRMIRQPKFDLYLPPPKTKLGQDSKIPKIPNGMVFMPGALVEHNAYASLASRLADEGIPVIVVNLEPRRLAIRHLGGNASNIKYMIKSASDLMSQSNKISHHCNVQCWSVAGHSMGAYCLTDLIECLVPIGITKMILMGSHFMRRDLSYLNPRLKVLVLHASNDGFYFRNQTKDIFFSRLPKDTTNVYLIEGGNHAGFAPHYGPQNLDKERTISAEEQQTACIQAICGFLSIKEKASKVD
eukprot:CAMPEP_0183703866 /NCGR_PEP_ID=MMETSP0737-20130205/1434_1 /TAXON_ID=385413 /ORGANISM="Thalassiosira miniscula, Strain CCMP1093" /LENGTH=352 /DNA_ID=CAMNT_0025930667 /DNA_START=20 /DNA_END=1078 /DNA_ORIENTATION=+